MALIGQGRQDWQRTTQADSVLLLSDQGSTRTGTVTFGPYNVAGFSSLQGQVDVTSGGYVKVDIFFWGDAAQTLFMGQRHLAVDSAGFQFAQIFTPCLSPYVTIRFTPLTGATVWGAALWLGATTRVSYGLTLPTGNLLADQQNVTIPANTNQVFNLIEIHGGPVTVSVQTGAVGMYWFIEAEVASGSWSRIAGISMTNFTTDLRNVILPPRPCRLNLDNLTAAGIVNLATVTPSLTGSS